MVVTPIFLTRFKLGLAHTVEHGAPSQYEGYREVRRTAPILGVDGVAQSSAHQSSDL